MGELVVALSRFSRFFGIRLPVPVMFPACGAVMAVLLVPLPGAFEALSYIHNLANKNGKRQ
jgi:hypothetical protein